MTYEEMVSEISNWLGDWLRYGTAPDERIRFERREHDDESGVMYFATQMNNYSISFTGGRYMGGVVSSRLARAGETWLRGNDLPDGEFSRETFEKIMRAVVGYEMEFLAPPVERRPVNPAA